MDIRSISLTALRRNIGVVFQEALLFNRSIADNLRVGRPDATLEEMRTAAARAQALDFIERGEHKFETNAGERGRMLSGGERQRLSIARALLKDPPILILDEATSALDAVTEAKVNAALDEVMKGRTTFVIAHRLSTIRNATRILLFDAGHVIESGTFDELVAKGGRFAELARAQFMVQPNMAPETALAAQFVVEMDHYRRGACDRRAARSTGGSAVTDRGRYRQGAAGRKRHRALVPGVALQADDGLCHAEGGQGRTHLARYAADGLACRGLAITLQDGFQARHPGHGRQRPQDDAGEVGQRYGRSAGRRRRR